MKHVRVAALLLPLLISACAPAQKNGNATITNGTITLATSTRDAGAVCSLTYDGRQFLNDNDHGRQMQVAWTFNNIGEKCNPTESGSGKDERGPSSTTRLVSLKSDGTTLSTESHPAYWFPPGPGGNTALVTNDTLKKTLTLGYHGDPHVIVFDSGVQISPSLTSPPITSIRIETPAIYTTGEFSDHYTLNKDTGTLKKLAPMSSLTSKDNRILPVMSTPDGRHAIACYSARAQDFLSYNSRTAYNADPEKCCCKMTLHFEQPAETGKIYTYQSFVIMGSLASVQASVHNLP